MPRFTEAEVAELNRIGRFLFAPMEFGTKLQSGSIVEQTPVNAVNAVGTLTLVGVAKHGETVTIGEDVYEFAADAAQTVTVGNIAVDIESYAGKAAGTLTVEAQPANNDTMTIGSVVYTFKTDGTEAAEGDISRGTDLATAQANIVNAITGTDDLNSPHPEVSCPVAFVSDDLVLTALIGGTAGNTIETTETFTSGSNVFGAAALATGTDCSAANAVTALVAASAGGTEPVTLTDGAGDTVVVTADVAGTLANAIATTETMPNGSFGAVTLASGVDGTIGVDGDMMVDNTYLYMCIANNTVSGKNWRRIALGSAF